MSYFFEMQVLLQEPTCAKTSSHLFLFYDSLKLPFWQSNVKEPHRHFGHISPNSQPWYRELSVLKLGEELRNRCKKHVTLCNFFHSNAIWEGFEGKFLHFKKNRHVFFCAHHTSYLHSDTIRRNAVLLQYEVVHRTFQRVMSNHFRAYRVPFTA